VRPSIAFFVVLSLLAPIAFGDGSGVAPVSKSNAPVEEDKTSEKESTCGDPVGMITGNAYETAEDLRVECPDVDLVMFRAYSSGSAHEGPLGYGWTHSYEWRAERAGGKVVVHVAGERGPSDAAIVFPAPPAGGESFSADGHVLRLSSAGLFSVTAPGGLSYEFNSAGLLSAVRTWNGTTVAVERASPSGPALRASHSCGMALVFDYGADGLLRRVSTPDAAVFAEYSAGDCGGKPVLMSVVRHDGPRASTNLYRWAEAPPSGFASLPPRGSRRLVGMPPPRPVPSRRPVLAGKTDANGVEGEFEYVRPDDSPFARCARTGLSGGLFAADLSFSGAVTHVERPYAGGVATTLLRRDAELREIERTTGGETLAKTYDAAGRLASERLSCSSTDAFVARVASYDARNRPVRIGSAFCAVPSRLFELEWDDRRGVPRRVATPAGRVAEWTTNGSEVVVHGAGTNDSRAVTRILLDQSERPVRAVLPDGGEAGFSYDAEGRVAGISVDGLPPLSLSYDALGRVGSLSLPGPGGTTRTASAARNWRGRPLAVTRFDGLAETFEYDGNGRRVVRHVDALGREDAYRWVLGLPVHAGRVVDGVTNALFCVEHDQRLNVVAITDPLGRRAETYVLDENERVVAVTNVEGQAMTRTYAVGGVVSSETRFDGSEVAYGYDADGNLASLAFPDETLSFAHDGDGLLVSASNSVGVVSNAYDAATGWLMASRGADGTMVEYSRRNGGGVASMTSVAGTTKYSHDAANRWTGMESPAATFGFGHCEWNGLLSSVTNANGLVAEYAYDVMVRVTNIAWRITGGAALGGFAYEYDAAGRIVSRTHTLGNPSQSSQKAYAYDVMDRLASDGGVTYTYDAAGNRMTKTENGETVIYTLGDGDRLVSYGRARSPSAPQLVDVCGVYSYDAAGNVTQIVRDGSPTLDLVWNGQYQLVSVSTNGVFAEGYAYDALGRRAATTTREGTTRHVYDDNWQVVADIDGQGNVLVSYVWGEGIDRLLAVKLGEATYYPLTDVQGTVWGYVDSQNNIVARWQYDAWGNVMGEEVSVPALAAIRYRFQCREWSAATGLTNFRMRWYDSVTGRWLSKDPIGLSGGMNLYAFCGNNSLSFTDVMGLEPSFLGQLWNMPNTMTGMLVGTMGSWLGGVLGTKPKMSNGKNAVQFLNNGLVPFGAITMGNIIIYGPGIAPERKCPEGTIGEHEHQHTIQGEVLGPLYFPAHIISGLIGVLWDRDWHGPHNFLEKGPQTFPPRPWPWK